MSAHKLLPIKGEENPQKKRKRVNVPNIQGKFGIAIMVGVKEVFLGVTLTDIIVEQIVKRKMVNVGKKKIRVVNFD